MLETVETGASIAWRVLASLEGGALALAASALLVQVARTRAVTETRASRPCCVVISNTSTALGRELAEQLRSRGCRVSAPSSDASSDAASDASSDAASNVKSEDAEEAESDVDALIVVGAEVKSDGMEGLSGLVSEDVYRNLKLLESQCSRVTPGGYVVWAASSNGAASGAFSEATAAFDDVLRARLHSAANASQSTPVWVGRHKGVKQTAAEVVTMLMGSPPELTVHSPLPASVRNIAAKVREYLGRLLKIIS